MIALDVMFPLSSVLAGPVVRRVEPTSASVWLALPSPARVRLQILDESERPLWSSQTNTLAIGEGLHIVLVSATGENELAWGQTYLYTLEIDDQPLEVSALLYDAGPRQLSFVLPAASPQETRILHGSCRRPSSKGTDALAFLDDRIKSSFDGSEIRPQLFGCTGDLIYADSPSPALLAMVGRLGDELLGYRELLPGLDASASEIDPGARQTVAGEHAGIYDPPARQLFGLGEFLAMHLMALSPTLWPEDLPEELRVFARTLHKVQRALANTAFYAIFDDHEVTDDWYLTRAWTERVLARPLGRRMICNGLSAFALVHAWGNQPAHFEEGQAGRRIALALEARKPGAEALERDLGMPREAGGALQPAGDSLPWHFRLHTPAVDLRSLDTRTMRAFPAEDPHGIPELLSEAALESQLSDLSSEILVILVPAPMAPPPRTRTEILAVRSARHFSTPSPEVRDAYRPDRGDEWEPGSGFFQRVLDRLPDRWICLGGDTHLAYAASVEQKRGRAAIFCSSGMKRETRIRRIRQALGFAFPWPWPRRPRVVTEKMTMAYLQSEKSASGKRYDYLGKNNIGELGFEGEEASLCIRHRFWWQEESGELSAVEHRVPLHKVLDGHRNE